MPIYWLLLNHHCMEPDATLWTLGVTQMTQGTAGKCRLHREETPSEFF